MRKPSYRIFLVRLQYSIRILNSHESQVLSCLYLLLIVFVFICTSVRWIMFLWHLGIISKYLKIITSEYFSYRCSMWFPGIHLSQCKTVFQIYTTTHWKWKCWSDKRWRRCMAAEIRYLSTRTASGGTQHCTRFCQFKYTFAETLDHEQRRARKFLKNAWPFAN